MTKSLDRDLRNLDKTPLLRDDGSVITLKEIVTNALLAAKDDGKPDGKASYERYKLANRLFDGGEHELTPEELALIKRLVAVLYGPLVVGQVYAWADE